MKTVLWSMLCLFLSGWGSMQAVLAQDLKEMEKNLSAINEELSQKTKEYTVILARCISPSSSAVHFAGMSLSPSFCYRLT